MAYDSPQGQLTSPCCESVGWGDDKTELLIGQELQTLKRRLAVEARYGKLVKFEDCGSWHSSYAGILCARGIRTRLCRAFLVGRDCHLRRCFCSRIAKSVGIGFTTSRSGKTL
jgi:hypothetical protein